MILIGKVLTLIQKIRIRIFLRKIKNKGRKIYLYFPLTIRGEHNVSIGDNTVIDAYVHIWGNGGVTIGRDVLIASHCCITSLTHDSSAALFRQKTIAKPVIIEDNVWLGYNVTVLPGVTIGKGSIIGAGAVVTKDIPPNSIAVGNPAKVIKQRRVD